MALEPIGEKQRTAHKNTAKLFWIAWSVIVPLVNDNTRFHQVKVMKFKHELHLILSPKQTLLNSILNIRVLDLSVISWREDIQWTVN